MKKKQRTKSKTPMSAKETAAEMIKRLPLPKGADRLESIVGFGPPCDKGPFLFLAHFVKSKIDVYPSFIKQTLIYRLDSSLFKLDSDLKEDLEIDLCYEFKKYWEFNSQLRNSIERKTGWAVDRSYGKIKDNVFEMIIEWRTEPTSNIIVSLQSKKYEKKDK